MSLFFRKSSLRRATLNLKSQLDTFRGFTSEPQYPLNANEKSVYCSKTLAALESATSLIQTSKDELIAILDTIEQDYIEVKKTDKKDFLEEFQQLSVEIAYDATLTEADAMLCALKTRMAEVRHENTLARSNVMTDGSTGQAQLQAHQKPRHMMPETNKINATDHIASHGVQPHDSGPTLCEASDQVDPSNHTSQIVHGSIKPPQISMPRFAGNAEEFHEYWAVFQAMVHDNPTLNVMEKMFLLKESLVGRAAVTIKGIKMIPQNYSWMVETVKKKYDNAITVRANIVQRLSNLRSANENNSEIVFDELRSLVNEMVSSGYDVVNTTDPMWIESILKKLPKHIVEEFLRENKDGELFTVGETLDHLETVINRYKYINRRLGRSNTESASAIPSQRGGRNVRYNLICHFCGRNNHNTFQCRTVHDPSDRRKLAMEHSLCWKCFSKNHGSNECSRPNCTICGRLHDQSLCLQKLTSVPSQKPNSDKQHLARNPVRPHSNINVTTVYHHDNSFPQSESCTDTQDRSPSTTNCVSNITYNSSNKLDQIVLMTAEGSVWNHRKNSYERALFFFDTGAQLSLVQEQAAEHLALPVLHSDQCTLSGVSGISETFTSHHVQLTIQTAHGRELKFMMQTKPTLTKGFPAVHLIDMDIQFMEENSIHLANTRLKGEHQVPQILVGIDLYGAFVPENVPPVQLPTGLRAARTIFGFAAYGRGNTTGYPDMSEDTHKACNTIISENMTESDMIKAMFELEGLGISTKEGLNEEATYSYLSKYAKSIRYGNNCVTAPFPVKENITDLTNNRNMAMKRLIAQVKHLNTHPEQQQWYTKIMKQYLHDDVIEEVKEPVPESVGTYYMPHSGVWKEHKSTPLRIVFDASSKQRGRLSLNDVLYTGATFVNKIHDILIACRELPIILIGDIQAAFTQIRIQESHRDLCRFLWLRDPDQPPFHDNIVEYRWKRLPFGTTASPSILNMVISAYLNQQDTKLANEIQRYLYVDNVLMTAVTPEEAIEKYKQSKALFAQIGMNLRAFVSNSEVVNSHISAVDRAPYEPMKLLGVNYNPVTDTFSFQTNFQVTPITKRDFLSQHHSLYDPMGFGAPLLIKQKHLMRDMLEPTAEWGSKVNPQLTEQWQLANREIDKACIEVPRYLLGPHTKLKGKSLWVFADASNTAMAVCAYMVDCNFQEVSGLLSGKTKLAPKKRELSTPKLELLAILLALRLAESISSALQTGVPQICIVSDSLIALSWIHTSRKLPLFVTNQRDRIRTIINRLTELGHEIRIYHVPGTKNPADTGTRGITGEQLADSDWISGPQWLLNEEQRKELTNIELIRTFPSDPAEEEESNEVVLLEVSPKNNILCPELLQLARFSAMSKAVRVTALVCKFIRTLNDHILKRKGIEIPLNTISKFSAGPQITTQDTCHAEEILIRQEQDNTNIPDLQRRHRDKHIYRDETGIIRLRSRLQNANLPYDTRNPMYIPPHSQLMRLILYDLHRDNGHCGKNHLLALARQRFWLPRPSRVIQQVIKNCAICQREQSLPFRTPPVAQLPSDRVRRAKPFEHSGCDLMGPFVLKDDSKVYVCLYTCLTIRAIHLELVENLSAEAFLNSFTRFIARRGVPSIVRTDCGTNFKLAQKVIDALFTYCPTAEESIMNYCAKRRITWIFNPPGAPWMGGAWERLVSSVKSAYHKCVSRKKLSFVEMTTVLTQIEAIINTRPLTAISTTDTNTLPLRPVDFLQGNLCYSLPTLSGSQEEDDDPLFDPNLIQTVSQAKEALAFSERTADKFWRIWNVEYLTMLKDVHKKLLHQHQHNVRLTPEVGEIVLIEQELIPRGHWTLGKIAKLIPSSDGLARSAMVQLPHRNIHIQRPVSKLYPLEIRSISEVPYTNESEDPVSTTEEKKRFAAPSSQLQTTERPSRLAKTKAQKALREQLHKESEDAPSEMVAPRSKKLQQKPHIHMLASLMTVLLLTRNCTAYENRTHITCSNGSVTVNQQFTPYELCFDNVCKNFTKHDSTMLFTLPPSPTQEPITVKIQSNSTMEIWVCSPAPFCDHVSNFLSKGLIANPHCWPIGALISFAIVTYLITIILILIVWIIARSPRNRQTTTSNTTNIALSLVERRQENAPFTLAAFEPAMLRRTESTILLICITLVTGISPCQDGYMRHSVDLTCTEREVCHYEFRREIIFNNVHHKLCILLHRANTSVGYIKITRKPIRLECSKISLFWTRDTKFDVRHVTRCRGMGSCTGDTCETLNPYEVIPELDESFSNPGYAACSVQCSGISCLCFLPFRACTFYRVAHIPASQQEYEVFKCATWLATVNLDITVSMYNAKKEIELPLFPYYTNTFSNLSFTVVSIQKPHIALNQRFAISPDTAIILPDNFRLPVLCHSKEQAQVNFSSCANTLFCDCDVSGHTPSCHCPNGELSTLTRSSDNLLPLTTSRLTIYRENNTVVAETDESETTVVISSKQRLDSAHLNIDALCEVHTGTLYGCYSCEHGSRMNLSCFSQTPSWTTINCANHIFSIECTPDNKTSTVKLTFDKAIVKSECYTICGKRNISVKINGILYYHVRDGVKNTFLYNVTTEIAQADWFRDLHLPDLTPLWMVALEHWKTSLTIIGIFAITIMITYMFGPMVVIGILRTTAQIVSLLIQLTLTAIQCILNPAVRYLRRLLTGLRADQ